MEIEWGPEIAVDGKRPEWLGGDVYGYRVDSGKIWHLSPPMSKWHAITKIRLPASHPAYIAIGKGFTPWSGGDEAPGDWDGGEVLFQNSETDTSNNGGSGWNWGAGDWTRCIIGYRRKLETWPNPGSGFMVTSSPISPQPIGSAAVPASYTVTRDGLTITGPDLAHILRSIKEDGE